MYANTSRAALDAAHLSPATPRPIVSLYDLDTSSYDIDPDGRTVRIYGAAFFRTAPQDVVRFALVLSRADLRDDEAPAWIDFDSDDLEAAGLALAEETAEAALLDALRTPGFNVAGAPAVLTPSLIDFYLPAIHDGAGSTEHIRAASGWCLFAADEHGPQCAAISSDAIAAVMPMRADSAEYAEYADVYATIF